MLYFKTDMGVLTDSYIAVFVKLDLDSFEKDVLNLRSVKTDNQPNIVPIRYMIRDCHSAMPTLRESLLSLIYKSVEEDSEMVIKQDRAHKLEEHLIESGRTLTEAILSAESFDLSEYSGCSPGTRSTNTSTLESIDEEAEEREAEMADEVVIDMPKNSNYVYMQNGDDFNTQLIKLESTYFKKLLL